MEQGTGNNHDPLKKWGKIPLIALLIVYLDGRNEGQLKKRP